jgi:hypothetical protein
MKGVGYEKYNIVKVILYYIGIVTLFSCSGNGNTAKLKTVNDTTFIEAKFPDSIDDKNTEQLFNWIGDVFEFPKNPTTTLDIRLGEDRAFSGWIIRIVDSSRVYKASYF